MINTCRVRSARFCSRGYVLLLAMLFMLMLAMVATTVMQTAILQFQMAGNDEFYEEALQTARAVNIELSRDRLNFSTDGDVTATRCPSGKVARHCDYSDLRAPTSVVVPAGLTLDYRVVRQAPLIVKGFSPREGQGRASSMRNVGMAVFEVDVLVDGGDLRLGRARLVQGVALRLAGLR